jgi:hypothetical protein
MHLAVGESPVFVKCVNPQHADKKRPNMAVYADHLECFACGYHCGCNRPEGQCGRHGEPHSQRCQGWQLDALAALLRITPEEAAAAAPRYSAERLDAYRERAATDARRDPLPTALANAYCNILVSGPRADRAGWLKARGLDESTLWEACLGHNGFQFTIPVFAADGALLTLRFRRDDEYGTKRPKYMGLPGRNGLYLYPENRLADYWGDTLVLCEGELDALLLWQHGIPAVSATNGARQAPKIPALLQEMHLGITHLIIATDQDEAGEEAARQTKAAAEALGCTTERAVWPKEFKDITEFYASGGRLA